MNEYIPHKQDIVILNFDPSVGKEIQKRRPAVVVSNNKYNEYTGLIAVCPITHVANNAMLQSGLLVKVHSEHVDGYVNPLQMHTFDYQKRQVEKVDVMDSADFVDVWQNLNFIF
ncbi:type II toxin-antitoxin system PemK/MazF family toxin [Periweissella cryptocerci]|uniref:Type II toxin-antitoxin system PemK/MazF family toxin n=1 Tax=Periweissella cryptocerci TaxID=2506420 RepID=A0A4P6YTJ2_9LACO|nr:type II toxin-antitoxin system PemK/MazF family toxin [Periweissella cryptocerci]QBO36079.1 type II toxin-antitoxin system PemK/MazF family toxin [Periweissella cryptocerci]